MSDLIYFPEDVWIGKEILVLHPFPFTWRLEMKIKETSWRMDKKESLEHNEAPVSFAIFECENINNTNIKAHMHIYMQIPLTGTEFATFTTRAHQASLKAPHWITNALKGYQLLTDACCRYTPILIAYQVTSQPPDGLVPGGYAQHMVTTKVSGDRLGNGDFVCFSNGPPDGPFWELEPEERSLIRSKFKNAWCEMNESGVMLPPGCLDNLFWNRTTQMLYIDGYFEPREQVYGTVINAWGPKVLHSWMLANMPESEERHMRDLYNYSDFNEEALENAGWIL